MNQKEIQVLLRKADELRALFVLGQRVIPFLEEIFLFVSDIEPILLEINTSIKENLKKMPKASKQLSKVTEATELATTEILDILDGLSYKNEILNSNLQKINDLVGVKENKPLDLLKLLLDGANKGSDINTFVPQIANFVSVYESSLDKKITEVIGNTKDINNSIVNDSSAIAMSLQVQDITSQQIAAVNNLLETVQNRLSVIMEKFKASELDNLINEELGEVQDTRTRTNTLHRTIAYDPDAVDAIEFNKDRQSEIDKLFNSPATNNDVEPIVEDVSNDVIDQGEIDKLLNNYDAGNNSEKVVEQQNQIADTEQATQTTVVDVQQSTQENIKKVEPPIEETAVNIESIGGDLDDEISQDDIDALFGKL
ncbi:MAG TPA: hypothetical protein PLE30_06020 [Candidatus Kapabacteria bacterium]|nr:hypothetical protein [Candidatus Kapabacteria bacterium]